MKRDRLLKIVAVLLALMAMGYPLSLGPVYALVVKVHLQSKPGTRNTDRMMRRERAVEEFYAPILAVIKTHPQAARWADRYVMFWLRVYGFDKDRL